MVKRKADIKLITHSKKFKLELENLSVASFVEVKEADLETLIKFDQGQEIIEENENKYRGAFAGALNAARIAIDAAKVDATHNPA